MVRVYTDIWNDFQFRAPTYLDGHFEPFKFDLVKWYDHEPWEAINLETGEKKISTRSCISIGSLIWDKKDRSFDFKSCGLRYLKYRTDGLEEFILDFCETMEKQLNGDEYENY
jgi:hypothetical protein